MKHYPQTLPLQNTTLAAPTSLIQNITEVSCE